LLLEWLSVREDICKVLAFINRISLKIKLLWLWPNNLYMSHQLFIALFFSGSRVAKCIYFEYCLFIAKAWIWRLLESMW